MTLTKLLIVLSIFAIGVILGWSDQSDRIVSKVVRMVDTFFMDYPVPTTPTLAADVNHIRSLLPVIDSSRTDCQLSLGEWQPAPNLSLSHQEGAIAVTPEGYAMLSGFSHYVGGLLMATSRVDSMQVDTLGWDVVNVPAPTIASHIQGASIAEFTWIAGGFLGQHPGKATDQVWRYSSRNHSWEAQPALPAPRASGALVALGDTLHYIGGLAEDRQSDLSEHLILDLSQPDEWRSLVEFPRARNHFQAVALGDVLFAVGGQTGHDIAVQDLPFLDAYSAIENRWIQLSDMPLARSHAEMSTIVFNNSIIVAGGRTAERSDAPIDSIAEYNPYNNEWRLIGTLPVPLISPLVRIIDHSMYVAGGGLVWNQPQTKAWTAELIEQCG